MTTLNAKNVQARGNILSGIERILNMPRARVYAAANPAFGGGVAFLPVTTVVFDTDGITSGLSAGAPYLTCQTAGVYIVSGRVECNSVAGGNLGIWLRILNPAQTVVYAEQSQWAKPDSIGCYMQASGLWVANKGDQIGLLLSTQATVSLLPGPGGSTLETCMISTTT